MDIIYKLFLKYKSSLIEHSVVKPLLRSVDANSHILEIGGGYNPRFKKETYVNAFHLDHCDTDSLKVKYLNFSSVAHLVDQIQTVDFVFDGTPIESLVPPDLRFDYIYSSHAIEHQVDFVGHLRSLEKILTGQGRIILVIPDLRACFDRLRFPTVTSDVLVVHSRNQSVHQGKQVFESLAQNIPINPGRLLTLNELQQVTFCQGPEFAYDAMRRAEYDGTAYLDIHAWTFTPLSFRLLMLELFLLDLVNLKIVKLSGLYNNQFCVVLAYASPEEKPELKKSYSVERIKLAKKLYRNVAG